MIKVKPRTAVPAEFVDALKSTARARLAAMKAEMEGFNTRYRPMYVKQHALAIARLQKLLKDPIAQDMEITRLRGLPFTSFWMDYGHVENGYFAAETKDIIVAHNKDKWNLGPYRVYMPVSSFIKGEVGSFRNAGFHFVPMREPLTEQRHMHHVCYSNSDAVAKKDPLLMNPSTCWGGFGPVVLGNVRDGDVVETFRTIYTYLTRYDASSPLAWDGLKGITHKTWVAA